MVTKNSTTITLTSEEQTVQFDRSYPYFWVQNLGGSDVLISMDSGIVDGADGVITVPAGGSCGTMHGYTANADRLYLLGSGKVQVMGTGSAFSPFKVARKGGEISKVKTIYNMPLKENLEDISGYDRVSVYNDGGTEQTITVANGLYLYNNSVSIDMSFLNDIIDNKFVIDFDFQYESTGATKYPYYRRIIWWYPFGVDITNNGSASTNYIAIAQYSTSVSFKTSNKYNDMLWHHAKLTVDLNTKILTFSIDNGVEILSITINSTFDDIIKLGHDNYGLNGYIRNFVITTGGAE